MSVNICLDNIFWRAAPFVTKLGMVMHHRGPECCAKRLFGFLQGQVKVKAHIIRYDCFYHIYWTDHPFTTKFKWMVHHHNLEWRWKIGLFCSRAKSQWRFKISLNLCQSFVFCTTDLSSTKLGYWCTVRITNNQTEYNKVGVYWQ